MNSDSYFNLSLILGLLIFVNSTFSQIQKNKNFYELSGKNDKSSDLNMVYYTAGIAAATGLFFLVDQPIRNEILNSRINKNDEFLKIGHNYGDFYYNLGFAGVLYASHFAFGNKEIGLAGKSLLEALLVGGLASITIKYIFGRSRPYKEQGNTKFNWFKTDNIFNSLPSGHVITAFTTSSVISNYIENIYVSFALYSLAGLTALQRIATDNHWFSDVFLGAGIGVIVGSFFSNKNKSLLLNSSSVHFIPFISKSNTSLYLFLEI